MQSSTGLNKSGGISDEVIAAENSMRNSINTVPMFVPEDADPQVSRVSLAYSNKEAVAIQQLFGLLAVNQFSSLKEFIAQFPEGEKRDEVLKSCVHLAIASGTPLRLIYLFIVDEFKDTSVEAFKPNSDATKIIQFYWDMVGKKYLKEVLMPTINQLTVINKKLSLELDQSKLVGPDQLEDMPRHRALVIEHMTQLVDKITSKDMVDKIPIPIKAILGQIHQLGRDRGKYYCGVVFLSRFLCSALADPITHRLIPGSKFLPNRVRRNFQILASLLRSALGAHQPEAALLGLSDLLRDFRNKLDTFVDAAIRSKSLDVGDKFINEITTRPLNNIHKFILQNQQTILKGFKDEAVALEFFKGIGSLSGYNTKWTLYTGFEVPSVSTADQTVQTAEVKKMREAVKTWLEQKNEIALFVGSVDKKNKANQMVKRIMVVTFNRLATFKPNGKIGRETYLFDLASVKSTSPKEFQITAQGWFIVGETEETDHLISCIRRAYDYSFPTTPFALKPKMDVQPSSRLEALTPHDRTPSEALIVAYKAACAYLSVPIKPLIITHISQAYSDEFKLKSPTARTFNIKHVYKHTLDTPTQNELEPLLFALRHNWHFDSLRIRNYKLERGLWGQVVDVMKYTSNINSLTLDNVNATTNGIASLAEAMQGNKSLKLQSLHIANASLGDKSVGPLIQYLATHPNAQFITKLNLTSLGLTPAGIQSLATDALPKLVNLGYLNLTGNKLALSTEHLVNWAVNAKSLHTLILAGTGFKIRFMVPALTTSKSLTKLDLSNRVVKKLDHPKLSQFAQTASSLQVLVLERSQLSTDVLKEIATQQYTIEIENNVLGLAGVQALLNSKMLETLKELHLDDTELTDEGITSLCSGLVNHPTLRLLSIGRGFKGSEGSKPRIAAVQAVAKMLQAVGVLEVFRMPGGTSTPYQLKGHINPILASLYRNNVLTELDISNHATLNAGAVALSKLIAENYTISTILWDGNGTGTLGFANVKNALKRNMALKTMPLPIADVVSVHKDDRVPQLEQQKLSTLLARIQSYLNRNQQL